MSSFLSKVGGDREYHPKSSAPSAAGALLQSSSSGAALYLRQTGSHSRDAPVLQSKGEGKELASARC